MPTLDLSVAGMARSYTDALPHRIQAIPAESRIYKFDNVSNLAEACKQSGCNMLYVIRKLTKAKK
ncbi:MAG: hypothetical protein KGZ88_21165 [Methylomicrobium sp.]|nr:hypothetical protein [Methylomicrobium sp.]